MGAGDGAGGEEIRPSHDEITMPEQFVPNNLHFPVTWQSFVIYYGVPFSFLSDVASIPAILLLYVTRPVLLWLLCLHRLNPVALVMLSGMLAYSHIYSA